MAQVSKPLIALLVATVAFFALWVLALKPHGSSGGSGGGAKAGLGRYQADINAAHQAVQTAHAASARAGADPAGSATTSTATAATNPTAASRTPARPVTGRKAAANRFTAVQRALSRHKVLALLVYNPAAPDDRAVRQQLDTVTTHGGRVFKLAIPLSEIHRYTAITDQVPVNLSPTLVLVAPGGQAEEIVGYTDPFEVSQRVDDALAAAR